MRSYLLAAVLSFGLVGHSLAADKLTVLLDWFINPDHAALMVAQERGLFAKHDLEVRFIEPADPNAPPRLVAAGQGDVAVSYQPQLHLQRAAGLPLRAVGVLVDQPLNSLVVLTDGPIKTPADLAGKRVGYSVGGFETAVLGKMLEGEGLELDSLELININFALTASLLSKRVDAVIGAFRNFELNQLALNKAEGRAFLPEDFGVPAYDELILVAHEDRGQDPAIARFLDALQEATAILQQDPQGAWNDFVASKPGLDDDLNRLAWRDTLPLLAQDVRALNPQRYADFARFMQAQGLIDTALEASDYLAAQD